MMLGPLNVHMQNNEVDAYLTPHVKINSKWAVDLREKVKL